MSLNRLSVSAIVMSYDCTLRTYLLAFASLACEYEL
jgi:hypothetical protein